MGFACDDVPKGVFPHRERVGLLEEMVLVELGLVHKPISPCPSWSSSEQRNHISWSRGFHPPLTECSQLPVHALCFVLNKG